MGCNVIRNVGFVNLMMRLVKTCLLSVKLVGASKNITGMCGFRTKICNYCGGNYNYNKAGKEENLEISSASTTVDKRKN